MKGLYTVIFLLSCCSGQRDRSVNLDHSDLKAAYFKTTFLEKFKSLDLPSDIVEGKRIDPKGLLVTDPQSLDSLFTQSSSILCYGVLSDTSNFYTVVFYAAAADLVPIISTFDKKGNQISSQGIDFGCSDGLPHDYSCDGHLTVDKEMNLTFEHTITCYDCDSTKSEPVKYIEKRRGEIKSNGQIELDPRRNVE